MGKTSLHKQLFWASPPVCKYINVSDTTPQFLKGGQRGKGVLHGHYLFRLSYRPIQYKSVCSPQKNFHKKGVGGSQIAENPFF